MSTVTTSERVTAVVGASGVIGRALLAHLTERGERVIGLSRRPPADWPGAPFVALDLLDAAACEEAFEAHLAPVTHLVYAALFEKPGLIRGWHESDQMQTNLLMLQNLLTPFASHTTLRHVTLLQGTKAYGAHVAPMKLPGLERDPRHPHDNFYWLQEDHLRQQADRRGWDFTIWRPQIVFGHARHAPMNPIAALGVYAALQRERGMPLAWPGGPAAVTEAVDADLLARAIVFGMSTVACAGETYNVTNGDVFRFTDIWGDIADMFSMSTGEPSPQLLADTCYDDASEACWQQIVRRHALTPSTIRDLVGDSFHYLDALFNTRGTAAPAPALLSTIKLREAGFHDCIDTRAMFTRWFERLVRWRVLPPP